MAKKTEKHFRLKSERYRKGINRVMKPPRKETGHSREREFTVVLEDIQSQFRVFGEGLGDVRNRLERVEDQLIKLDAIERDVSAIKLAFPSFATRVSNHEARLSALEHSR